MEIAITDHVIGNLRANISYEVVDKVLHSLKAV